jgi:glycosyltransferase involved in cell wall biosynthesis
MASRKPFHGIRTALWHLRTGGLPQVREWRSRQVSPEELAKALQEFDREQRGLEIELHNLKLAYESAEQKLQALSKENQRLETSVFANAAMSGLAPELDLGIDAKSSMAKRLLASGEVLPLLNLIKDSRVLERMTITQLRQLNRRLNATGYWHLTSKVQKQIAKKSGNTSDQAQWEKTISMLSVFRSPLHGLQSRRTMAHRKDGPVLHVVGKGLLDIQTGYTLRTAFTVQAQLEIGIPGLVAIQPGGNGKTIKEKTRSVYNGIEYIRLRGKPRAQNSLVDWLAEFVSGLEEVIAEENPSLLHAHSDFLNGAAAIIAARKHGIPVVYESRGFWEESWLSRLSDKLELGPAPRLTLEPFGLPEAYTLRQRAEEQVRANADVVITLADVMKEHIEESHADDDSLAIEVVPNAVRSTEFTPRKADDELAQNLGIGGDTVVIGYITSMVEYEGIDVLLRGFATLLEHVPDLQLNLLLVGDGPVLPKLKNLAQVLNIDNAVIFTGQVPHESIVRYYSLIDIFVVPRRPTSVSSLVTPLKPFEAMAMAKPLVVSGVDALQEIAEKSQAARVFTPNDHDELAHLLLELVKNEPLREELGERGRQWVIHNPFLGGECPEEPKGL